MKYLFTVLVLLIVGCDSGEPYRKVYPCSQCEGGLFQKNSGYSGFMVFEGIVGGGREKARKTRCIPCELATKPDELFVCYGMEKR